MGKLFWPKIKDYFTFTKRDRNGILVLMVLNIMLIAGAVIIKNTELALPAEDPEMVEFIKLIESRQNISTKSSVYFYFDPNKVDAVQLDSFPLPPSIKRNIISYREAGGKYNKPADLRKIYGMTDSIFSLIEPWLVVSENVNHVQTKKQHDDFRKIEGEFDPNIAGMDELSNFGFDSHQISTLLKYRSRGGVFHEPNDLLRIYGIDSSMYQNIKNHIRIAAIPAVEIEQIQPLIELNSADSVDLVSLSGIGPVFASRIIKYRNLLGGFCSARQLLEVYGFPEETYNRLENSFSVDTFRVEKIRLNFAGYAELIRHPYLEKNHVASILSFREKNGAYSSPAEILQQGVIDTATYLKVVPYVTCR